MVDIPETVTNGLAARSSVPSMQSNRLRRSRFDVELQTPTQDSNSGIADAIAAEIWKRLPIARLVDEIGHRRMDHTIRVANATSAQFAKLHGELRQWAEAICHAAIEIRGAEQVSDKLINQLVQDITRKSLAGELFSLPPRPFVDCQFAELSPEKAVRQAEARCEKLCLELANEVFRLLERLHQHQLVGKLTRGKTTCSFTFFRRVAILDADVQKEFDRFRPTREPILLGDVQTIDTVQPANVTTTYRTALHTHYVNRPTWNISEHAKFPLPDQYQSLLDSSPVWLQRSLRVLEGDLIREQQIEIDTGREELLDEQVVSTRRLVYRDPAIVLGDYVLAGWGESEICDQEQRIQNKQVVKDKNSKALVARQYRWCSYGVAVLALCLAGVSSWGTPLTVSLAILLSLAAVSLTGVSNHLLCSARDRLSPMRVTTRTCVFAGVLFAILSLILGILHASVVAYAVAGLSALLSFGMASFSSDQ